jgi:DNA-binding transcriptional MerR regulator
VYDNEQLRMLQIVVLLRQAGYNFAAIRSAPDKLALGQPEWVLSAVEERKAKLAAASRRCAAATAAL